MRMIMKNAGKYLSVLLWLIALHSFTAGILLITLGNEGIKFFGFPEGNQFFQVQGGVFHLVMCVAYILASYDTANSRLIIFIILAKLIALVYLLAYFFFIEAVSTILLSGLADGMMALLVWYLWRSSKKEAVHE